MFKGKKDGKFERHRPEQRRSQNTPTIQYYRSADIPPREQGGGRQNRTPETRQRGRVASHLNRLPAYISMIVIGVSLVYCSILGNSASVVLSGDALHEKSFYDSRVGDALNSSWFNHSKLTLDIRALKQNIQAQIPEAAEVTVSIPLVGKKPVVGLTLTPAKYLLSLPNNQSFIIGADGVILADAKDLDISKKQNIPLLQEDVPLKLTVGNAVLSVSDMNFISTVTAELRKANLEISLLELPLGASELYVHLKSASYYIKYAFNGDARQQVGAYLAVKNELGSVQPTSYIDVRIGERAYVK